MVTEAFAVMAAVSSTVGTINIVKGWIAELRQLLREHRNAGETLLELYLGFDKCQTQLDLWMRTCGVDKPTSRRYQKELWGKRGMDTIAMQVTRTSINSICDSIRNDLAPFLRNITLDGQDPNEGIASMSILSFRMESNRAKKGLSVKDTMAFVIFKGPRMLKELSISREKIIELRGLSLNAYTVEHGSSVSNALTSSQLDDSRTSVLL